MAKGWVKWLHAPGHAGSVTQAVVERAVATNALIIDWSEMYWNTGNLKTGAPHYNHFIGKNLSPDSRKRIPNHDVVISTRSDALVIHDEEFFVDREIKGFAKYMPERHGKARVILYDGLTILIIAWHPQPNPLRRMALVFPHFKRSVRRVEKIQEVLIKEFNPDIVLNGGDLQMGPGRTWIAPNQMAKRLGMQVSRVKIDWQLWKGEGWKKEKTFTIDPSHVNKGMDHEWSVLVLTK